MTAFCKDCRYRIPHPDSDLLKLSLCDLTRPEPDTDYLVTGSATQAREFCSTMRIRFSKEGGCGPEGSKFEPLEGTS